jgi:hypothetical protein
LSDFDILWNTEEGTGSSIEKTVNISVVYDLFQNITGILVSKPIPYYKWMM